MSKRLIILGGGGHAKVVADIAQKTGFEIIGVLDDYSDKEILGFPVLGKTSDAEKFNDGNTQFIIAIGNNAVRKKLSEQHKLPWATLIHPSAQLGLQAAAGEGTVIMAEAVINPCSEVGRHCIVNSGAVIEHDNVIADFVHISPRAALGGTVTVCEQTHIGIGAAVKNNIKICARCTVGAGAVIVEDIEEEGVYVGVPARKIK